MNTRSGIVYFTGLVLAGFLLLHFIRSDGQAVISGDCEVCHAKFPGMMEPKEPGKPLKFALQESFCVDCHTSSDRDPIKILGGARVPVVYNGRNPSGVLAGGNFHYVSRDFGTRKGHNVKGITSADPRFKGKPPGYDRIDDPSIIGYNPKKPLTCAGSNGCHGDRNIEDQFLSIIGSHHADDTPIDGSTTAKSYRYLKNTDRIKGILGLEDEDWGRNSTAKKHNEYSPTINQFCGTCHGDFHNISKTGSASPWFRHPTDVVIPKRGEYLKYNPDVPPPPNTSFVRIYNPDAPVARQDPVKAVSGEVQIGTDIVTCLSCHMAHASPYASSLRWDYDLIFTAEEGKGGCIICHTGKAE